MTIIIVIIIIIIIIIIMVYQFIFTWCLFYANILNSEILILKNVENHYVSFQEHVIKQFSAICTVPVVAKHLQ